MIDDNVANRLLTKLKVIKPALWNPHEDEYRLALKTWSEYLNKKNITMQMIVIGLDRAASDPRPFFPSIGQFIEWCRYIPETDDLRRSYRHARKRINSVEGWAHPVIYHAALTELGAQRFLNLEEKELMKEWGKAIESAKDKWFAGELPEIPKPETLIEQQKAEISEEQRQENIDRLRGMI